MYAVVSFYGQQYKIYESQVLKVDKLDSVVGSELEFCDVLVLFKNDKFIFGKPYINECKIKLCILSHGRDKKINVVKFKRRKHYMKKLGHKQWYTMVKILSIDGIKNIEEN